MSTSKGRCVICPSGECEIRGHQVPAALLEAVTGHADDIAMWRKEIVTAKNEMAGLFRQADANTKLSKGAVNEAGGVSYETGRNYRERSTPIVGKDE